MEKNVQFFIKDYLDEKPNTQGQWEINSVLGQKIKEYLNESGVVEKHITDKINSKSFLIAQIDGLNAKLRHLEAELQRVIDDELNH